MMAFDPNRWNSAFRETRDWLADELRLQRPDGPALHQLLEAWRNREIIEGSSSAGFVADPFEHFSSLLDANFHVFIIEHDWASAFANSNFKLFSKDEEKIDFIQPYEHCCFEFLISGKRVCFIAHANKEASVCRIAIFIKLRLGWFQGWCNHPDFDGLITLVGNQHQAAMVALDAAIAETTVVRAPHKLNHAREKRGRLPVFDYHVINLARRSRPATLPSESERQTNGVRLHFRRGHWRHFEAFKTWINWTLVGDPDLGFVDKHYRL
jgi:hypothetical protein